jgi:hypothetical protein
MEVFMGSERFWMLAFFGLLGVCVGWALSENKEVWSPPLKDITCDYAEARIGE